MSMEYTSGEYVYKKEKCQRGTPHDSSSFCNTSKRHSIGVCACGVVEFRNKTLHGTVTVQQCPQSVRTCNNASQQPSANSSASWHHNKGGGMQKKSSSVAESMQPSNRVFHDTKIRELPHSFIQREDQQFFFFFGRLTKPTAHTIRRGSLLEKQHGIIVGTALAQSVRNPPEMNNVGKRSNRRRTEQWYRECESERSAFSTPRRRRSTPGKELGSSFRAVCVAK